MNPIKKILGDMSKSRTITPAEHDRLQDVFFKKLYSQGKISKKVYDGLVTGYYLTMSWPGNWETYKKHAVKGLVNNGVSITVANQIVDYYIKLEESSER